MFQFRQVRENPQSLVVVASQRDKGSMLHESHRTTNVTVAGSLVAPPLLTV